MSKKNGTARAEVTDAPEALPKTFSYRPADALNVRLREYLLDHGISFNELCDAAVIEYLARHPRWERRHLRLPRGKRPRNP